MQKYLVSKKLLDSFNLELILKSHASTTEFMLENYVSIRPEALKTISNYGKNIKKLSLRGCSQLSNEILTSISNGCKFLNIVGKIKIK